MEASEVLQSINVAYQHQIPFVHLSVGIMRVLNIFVVAKVKISKLNLTFGVLALALVLKIDEVVNGQAYGDAAISAFRLFCSLLVNNKRYIMRSSKCFLLKWIDSIMPTQYYKLSKIKYVLKNYPPIRFKGKSYIFTNKTCLLINSNQLDLHMSTYFYLHSCV